MTASGPCTTSARTPRSHSPRARSTAARFAFRPDHRGADRPAGHRTGGDLPRRDPRRRHLRESRPEQWSGTIVSVLEIRDLHVAVKLPDGGRKPILAGVNLTVRAGETHAIMGP